MYFLLKFPAVLTHACCYVSVCNGIRYVGKVVWYYVGNAGKVYTGKVGNVLYKR